MQDRARRTFWFLSSNYALIGLNLITGIVLLPTYLRHIGANTYGAWLATGEVLAWLGVIDPGLGAVVQQRLAMAFGQRDASTAGQLIAASYCAMLAFAGITGVCGWAIAGFIPRWLALPSEVPIREIMDAYAIALLGTVLLVGSYASSSVGCGLQKAHAIGWIGFVASAAGVAVTLFGVTHGLGVRALAYGMLVRGAGQFFLHPVVVILAVRESGFAPRFSLRAMRGLFGVSLYNALSQWGALLAGRVDSLLLTRVIGPHAATSLSITRRGPSLLQMVVERPSFSVMPVLSELHGSGDLDRARHIVVRIQEICSWTLGVGVAAFLALNAPFVRLWVGSELFTGTAINALVCTSVLVRVSAIGFANYTVALGNIRGPATARFVESILYVVLAVVGVHMWGILGMVAADLIAACAVSVWYFPRAWARLAQPSRQQVVALARELAISVALGLATAVVASRFDASSWPRFVLVAAILVLVYALALTACSMRFRAFVAQVVRRMA